MSPRRLSADAKALKGTLRLHREPKAARAVARLPIPATLTTPEQQEAWHDLTRLLAAERKLVPAAAVAIESAARDLAINRMASALLDEEGLVLVWNGPREVRKAHPAAALVDQSSKRLRAWCVELGLTSASAGRVAAAPAKGSNPFEELESFGALRRKPK